MCANVLGLASMGRHGHRRARCARLCQPLFLGRHGSLGIHGEKARRSRGRTAVAGLPPPHVCQTAHVCQRLGVGKYGQTRASLRQLWPPLPSPLFLADMGVLAHMERRPARHAADQPSPASRPLHVGQALMVGNTGGHGPGAARCCQPLFLGRRGRESTQQTSGRTPVGPPDCPPCRPSSRRCRRPSAHAVRAAATTAAPLPPPERRSRAPGSRPSTTAAARALQ